MSKGFIISLAAFIFLVGCKTTEQADVQTKPQVAKEIPKKNENPFDGMEIPPAQVVTSMKPVLCGRTDTILQNLYDKFGEIPVMYGQSESAHPDGRKVTHMVTMAHNPKTGTFTFVEQMPNEERLLCILSSGHAKFRDNIKKGSSL